MRCLTRLCNYYMGRSQQWPECIAVLVACLLSYRVQPFAGALPANPTLGMLTDNLPCPPPTPHPTHTPLCPPAETFFWPSLWGDWGGHRIRYWTWGGHNWFDNDWCSRGHYKCWDNSGDEVGRAAIRSAHHAFQTLIQSAHCALQTAIRSAPCAFQGQCQTRLEAALWPSQTGPNL